MEETVENSDGTKRGTVKRPMNAFLIFCKRHRGLVHQKNPSLDNRSVTRILGDLWANLGPNEKCVYTDLAKQYREAFLKANPDYKWYNPEKHSTQAVSASSKPGKPPFTPSIPQGVTQIPGGISPGKLADPSNMGGLSMLLMAGQQTFGANGQTGDIISLPKSVTATVTLAKMELCDVKTTTATATSSDRNLQLRMQTASSIIQKESMMPICSAIKSFGKLDSDESLSIWKHGMERSVGLSHAGDVVQNCYATASSCFTDRVKEEIPRAQGVTLPNSNPSQAFLNSHRETKSLEEINAVAMQHPVLPRDLFAIKKSSCLKELASSASPPKSDVCVSVVHSGPGVSIPVSSVVNSDPKTGTFFGNPLMYLFNQPTCQISGWPRQAVIPSTGMQMELPCHDSIKSTEPLPTYAILSPQIVAKLSGVVNDLVFDASNANFDMKNLQQMVIKKVIETAYSNEQRQEPSIQLFPKTKKQLAVDKLSSTNKPATSFSSSANQHTSSSSTTDAALPCVVTCLTSYGMPADGGDQVYGDKLLTGEEKKMEPKKTLDKNLEEVDAVGMTIAQISEKLITKIVQEEAILNQGYHRPPINESRLPLKLQKKLKSLDGVDLPRSPNLSPPDRSTEVADQLLSTADIFSGLVEKSSFPTARGRDSSISIDSNMFLNNTDLHHGSVLPAYNYNLCSSNAPSSTGNGPSLTEPSSSQPFGVPGAPLLAVNKLIGAIIAESFSGSKSMGHASSSRTAPSHLEGNWPVCEREGGPNGDHPLKHTNKLTNEIKKTSKRKRNRKSDSLECSHEGNVALQTARKTTSVDNTVGVVRSDLADGVPPKRLKESTVSARAKELSAGISTAAFDSRAKSRDSSSVKFSDAWRSNVILMNEGIIDFNGRCAQEEINNNSREKTARSVGRDTLPLTNKTLRKSKRSNQGLRYKELMSKGVLYTSRKTTDCYNLNVENGEYADVMEDNGVARTDFFGAVETVAPRRHFHGGGSFAENEIDVNGRRYKSGDFDLEAHIACLPACQIEVTDRKSAGKVKSRSLSQSQSSVSASLPLAQIQLRDRNDLNLDQINDGLALEEISFSKLRSLTRVSAVSKNPSLLGSCRRKNRTYSLFRLLPMFLYNTKLVQMKESVAATLDDQVLSSNTSFTSAPSINSQRTASASRQSDRTVELSRESGDDQNFHILAAAAAVSSGD